MNSAEQFQDAVKQRRRGYARVLLDEASHAPDNAAVVWPDGSMAYYSLVAAMEELPDNEGSPESPPPCAPPLCGPGGVLERLDEETRDTLPPEPLFVVREYPIPKAHKHLLNPTFELGDEMTLGAPKAE